MKKLNLGVEIHKLRFVAFTISSFMEWLTDPFFFYLVLIVFWVLKYFSLCFPCFLFPPFFMHIAIVQLGSRLIELLTETAYVQPPVYQSVDMPPDVRPAFRHRFKTVTKYPG